MGALSQFLVIQTVCFLVFSYPLEFVETMHLRLNTLLVTLPLLFTLFNTVLASVSEADTIMLGASKDNTLINNTTGNVSNGEGPLFAGLTGGAGPGALRALIAFDVASEIPAGATITDVQLTLTILQAGNGSNLESYGLHRVEQDWGEGKSFASGGNGAPSEKSDATWIHTFHDNSFWTNPGGDFQGTPSATETIGVSGPVTWSSTSDLVADVQNWLDAPSSNFGWLLIGDEIRSTAARKFGSRESTSGVPELAITFTPVPEPHSLTLVILGSSCALAFLRRKLG